MTSTEKAAPERIVQAAGSNEEEAVDRAIRPKRLADYVGQEQVKAQLEIFVKAAVMRGEALDHALIFGPPGLGKTTLANILASELGVNLRQTSGPVLERPGDLAALLTNLQPRDVLFIDEIHRLSPVVEEVLYPAMEDYPARHHDRRRSRGAFHQARAAAVHADRRHHARGSVDLAAAGPLRHRAAPRVLHRRRAREDRHAFRGHPRRAHRRRRRRAHRHAFARHAAHRQSAAAPRARLRRSERHDGRIDEAVARAALDLLEVDPQGFDALDRKLLSTIIEKFDGGPVGIESLSAAVGEERGTLEDVIEPFLIQQGFLMRTSRGRMATRTAYLHFGLKVPERVQASLPLFEADDER